MQCYAALAVTSRSTATILSTCGALNTASGPGLTAPDHAESSAQKGQLTYLPKYAK
jgi:hypothetical protein